MFHKLLPDVGLHILTSVYFSGLRSFGKIKFFDSLTV